MYGNLIMILPYIISCIFRIKNMDINIKLWTDHFARLFMVFSIVFYLYEMVIKYVVDGGDTICQKGFFIHHISSLFIITPLIINHYIPWWANPIGFLHGFCIYFPESKLITYIYAVAIMYFQYSLYQPPCCNLRYYNVIRVAINGIWVFCIYLLIGDCSNFLPLTPD